jgi:hypothetical protein
VRGLDPGIGSQVEHGDPRRHRGRDRGVAAFGIVAVECGGKRAQIQRVTADAGGKAQQPVDRQGGHRACQLAYAVCADQALLVGERDAKILGLTAQIAAGQVGIVEQPRSAVAKRLVTQLTLAIGALTN